jgi:hypothetical protein
MALAGYALRCLSRVCRVQQYRLPANPWSIGAGLPLSVRSTRRTPWLRALCAQAAAADQSDARLGSTQRWLDEMVVGMVLCPFTKPLRNRPSALRMQLTTAKSNEQLSEAIDSELALLRPGIGMMHPPAPIPETTLLVLGDKVRPPVLEWRCRVLFFLTAAAAAAAGR